jgi:hypothetical protein
MLLEEIDGAPAAMHPIAPFLGEAGFVNGALGMQRVASRQPVTSQPAAGDQSSVGGRSRQPLRRRPSKSTVSSPFARRYFDEGED